MLLVLIYLVVVLIIIDLVGLFIVFGVVVVGFLFYWFFIGSDYASKCIVNIVGVIIFLYFKNVKLFF